NRQFRFCLNDLVFRPSGVQVGRRFTASSARLRSFRISVGPFRSARMVSHAVGTVGAAPGFAVPALAEESFSNGTKSVMSARPGASLRFGFLRVGRVVSR